MKCTPYAYGVHMVDARVELKQYSNRVIAVVKAKYGLRDKSEALNKFIETYGPEELEPEVKDSYVKKILRIEKAHYLKHGLRSTTVAELRKEIEGK